MGWGGYQVIEQTMDGEVLDDLSALPVSQEKLDSPLFLRRPLLHEQA